MEFKSVIRGLFDGGVSGEIPDPKSGAQNLHL